MKKKYLLFILLKINNKPEVKLKNIFYTFLTINIITGITKKYILKESNILEKIKILAFTVTTTTGIILLLKKFDKNLF
jgi:hypothetical protein